MEKLTHKRRKRIPYRTKDMKAGYQMPFKELKMKLADNTNDKKEDLEASRQRFSADIYKMDKSIEQIKLK
ncbi:MAG: hypothetical protein ACHQET_06220 [Chitinophagales bacterium]